VEWDVNFFAEKVTPAREIRSDRKKKKLKLQPIKKKKKKCSDYIKKTNSSN